MTTTVHRIISILYRARTQKYEVRAIVKTKGHPSVITLYYKTSEEAKKLKKGDIIDGND